MTMLATCMLTASCSSDDEYSYVDEINEANIKESIIGTWHLLAYNNGWGDIHEYGAGEITVIFKENGEMTVVNKTGDNYPIPTATFSYSFVNIEKSIYNHEPAVGLLFNGLVYSCSFSKGLLHISAEAYDGPGYSLKKLQ